MEIPWLGVESLNNNHPPQMRLLSSGVSMGNECFELCWRPIASASAIVISGSQRSRIKVSKQCIVTQASDKHTSKESDSESDGGEEIYTCMLNPKFKCCGALLFESFENFEYIRAYNLYSFNLNEYIKDYSLKLWIWIKALIHRANDAAVI